MENGESQLLILILNPASYTADRAAIALVSKFPGKPKQSWALWTQIRQMAFVKYPDDESA